MSVNLGNDAITAIKELRGNVHFDNLVSALGVFAQTMMLAALDTSPEQRVDKTAYAQGFYHMWKAMHAANTELHMSQVKLPPLAGRSKANTNV